MLRILFLDRIANKLSMYSSPSSHDWVADKSKSRLRA